jgi:hypothetical protein
VGKRVTRYLAAGEASAEEMPPKAKRFDKLNRRRSTRTNALAHLCAFVFRRG